MKKTLIALAVAGVVAAPAAFAATSNVDVYGMMMFSLDNVDTNDAAGDSSDFVTGQDNNSRFGIKGSEDLGGGLSAIWQVEMQLNASNDEGVTTAYSSSGTYVTGVSYTSGTALRNTFVGLSSKSLGTVILGRHDTPYKLATSSLDIWSDSSADYNNIISRTSAAGSNLFDLRASQTVAYITPTMSGFHAAAAYVEVKANEGAGADNLEAFSIMGMYNNGPLLASLAYETHSGGVAGSTASKEIDAWKLGLGYNFGNAKIGFVYENMDSDVANSANSRDAWYLNGAYTMGSIVLKAAYGTADESDASVSAATKDGADSWTVGADYLLSKRTTVFAFYNEVNNDINAKYRTNFTPAAAAGKDIETFSLGVKHTF